MVSSLGGEGLARLNSDGTVDTTFLTGTGTSDEPFTFVGNGTSDGTGQQEGGLADSSGNSGQVGHGDAAQLSNGELNNVANPQATGALNLALGPAVFHNLSDALQDVGGVTDAADAGAGTGATATVCCGLEPAGT